MPKKKKVNRKTGFKASLKRFIYKWSVIGLALACVAYYFFGRDIIYTSNICHIYDKRPHWDFILNGVEREYGVPGNTILAFMKQESSFDANAKPPFKKLWGIIPYWERQSSSHGYSQAVNGTWHMYQRHTKDFNANRTSFYDSAHFIGWYINQSRKRNNLTTGDIYELYLSYHEGWGGFNKKTYNNKPSLLRVAKRVEKQSLKYKRDLPSC